MAQDILGTSTDSELKKKMALQMLLQGSNAAPVQHWTQALARVLQGGLGGYMANQAQQEDADAGKALFNSLPGVATSSPATPSPAAPAPTSSPASSAPSPDIANAITAASQKYGVDPAYLTKTASIESGNNPAAASPNSSARGLFQFTKGTWGQYGNGGNPNDANASTDAAARLAADNARAFKEKFGRVPSNGELYLMHQQGAGGASALIANPNANVVDALLPAYGGDRAKATAAVANNGGSPNQTAGDFASRWTGKFDPRGASTLPGAAQPNAPVGNRSSVNIPPDVAATIQRLGSDPRTRPQAMQLYMQYAKPIEQYQQGVDQSGVPYQRNSVTGEIKADPRKDASIQHLDYARQNWKTLGLPDPSDQNNQPFWQDFSQKALGGPSTNVSVNTAANPIYEGIGKQFVTQRQGAQTAAVTTIPAIHEARKALDEGAITGAFAPGKVNLQKVGTMFGLDASQAQNTEVLQSAIGQGVLAHIKELGANPSNADRTYIEKVQGGKIELEEGSIRRILDIQEKYARQSIRNFNSDSNKLRSVQGGSEAFKGIAPLMSIDEPGAYVAPEKKAAATTGPGAPTPGTIQNGYRFKGGDPSKQTSWEPVT